MKVEKFLQIFDISKTISWKFKSISRKLKIEFEQYDKNVIFER
jgi:hypothetical protein